MLNNNIKIVNCGCGSKFCDLAEWENIDFSSLDKRVITYNLLKGIPLDDNSADAVFTSCMLEHFSRSQVRNFFDEAYRCLKKDGTLRVVVPDLENVCHEYLEMLNKVRNDSKYSKQYEYITIELLDQMTRKTSGGEMQKYWDDPNHDEDFVMTRTGYPEQTNGKLPIGTVLKNYMGICLNKIFGNLRIYRTYRLGKFMESGEVHQWMYDSYSLGRLFVDAGFKNIRCRSYNESDIPNWSEYGVESNSDGSEYKPNSLYMEGSK